MAEETKVETSFWERFTDTLGAWGEGIVNFLGRLFGSSNERYIRSLGYIRAREGEHTVVPGSLLAQVNDIEIWIEPNKTQFWAPQFDPDESATAPAEYEALLARCWDVLHAVRSTVNIICSQNGASAAGLV